MKYWGREKETWEKDIVRDSSGKGSKRERDKIVLVGIMLGFRNVNSV